MKRLIKSVMKMSVLAGMSAFPISTQPAGAVVFETLHLVPDDSTPGDDFGEAVALSGEWAVVGSPGNGPAGAAYIFNATTGQQLHKLVPADLVSGAQFGRSIAVDGDLAVIGAHGQDIAGAAYIYDLTSGSQVGKLVSLDVSAGDLFGFSVAIHGTTALIGAPLNDDGFNNAGSAYLFDAISGTQLQKFTAEFPAESDRLGDSVAFDGGLVAVGALITTATPDFMLFDPTTGDLLARVDGTDSTTTGSSLAIFGDQVLMGSPSVFNAAIAGLFDISDVNNVITTPLPWPGEPLQGHFFGDSVALSEQYAVVSTWFSGLGDTGIVYLFDPDTGAVLGSFRPSGTAVDDRFGDSIDVHNQTLIVGAPGQSLTDTGAAYLFTIPEPATMLIGLTLGPALIQRRHTRRSAIAR